MGPLAGVRVLEFAGIGPGPYACQILADAGADVVRVDNPNAADVVPEQITLRNRRSMTVDLKSVAGVEAAREMMGRADVVIEGFRPGVMERLGLGPDVALGLNRALVYGRMTGWGQLGPLATAAGHDINYISLTGALNAIGSEERPAIPLNLIGDFGGGAMFLVVGVLAALLHAQRTGEGQVVDASIVDGVTSLMSYIYGFHAEGKWRNARASNRLDGGAPFYNVYKCKDGRFISVAAYEAKFFDVLIGKLGLTNMPTEGRLNADQWPAGRAAFAEIFRSRTRDEWCALLEGSDACFAPVLDLCEAPHHAHNQARDAFITIDGVTQPAPAPRFSATPGGVKSGPPAPGAHNLEAPIDWGLSKRDIRRWASQGAFGRRERSQD